ncbi:MAG: tRNA lysidine(34) synthetase TilS [Flavobacteriaceae bacterium]|nr:tRNA lysidine(34) synthetase TilS [Flavobacteriaceae bacterium]|tara:strand:+ start:35909 stop:37219 length:1311 start_codon:yes stop_codon:yes gene_type:complete
MLKAYKHHIEDSFPFLKEGQLLVACSGGLDSVVLAHILRELGFKIGLAHCNFYLRGNESDEDEAFVIDLAEKWNVPVFTETFNTKEYAATHKLSTQMAARELRYAWFEELLKDFKYDYILTAHHADDNLETFLINLSRGTGLRGLTGITEQNDKIIRPLLPFSREEIFNFAKKEKLFWREDSSNASSDYLRNELRHEVIPPFKKATKGLLKSLQKTQRNLQQTEALVSDYLVLVRNLVMEETSQGFEISIVKLKELPNPDALLYELLSPFQFTAWEDISGLLHAQSGKQVLASNYRVIKDREVLIITKIPSEEKKVSKFISENETQIDSPLKMSFFPTDKMGYIDTNTVYVDASKISYPLVLRRWEEGDVFQPFGMKGKKKLSKFFKDEKLSLASKEQIWILLSNNQIVWVVGYRMDDRFKITPKTDKILKIAVTN